MERVEKVGIGKYYNAPLFFLGFFVCFYPRTNVLYSNVKYTKKCKEI